MKLAAVKEIHRTKTNVDTRGSLFCKGKHRHQSIALAYWTVGVSPSDLRAWRLAKKHKKTGE